MMFWIIIIVTILLAVGMLWLRDRGLEKRGKTRGKTPEQIQVTIQAAGNANVASYGMMRGLGVGSILLIGAFADYSEHGATLHFAVLVLLGLGILAVGIIKTKEVERLQKIVDSK